MALTVLILNCEFPKQYPFPNEQCLLQKLLSSENMQHYEEKINIKNKKISKPTVEFQKPSSTYVVAFAIQEAYDEPPTGRQRLCKKRSLSETISSITPTASNDMMALDFKSVQKLVQTSDEIKIDILEEHDNQSGDVKKNPPQKTVYVADNNIAEDSYNIQPQILYDSTKNKSKATRRRSKKSNHAIKVKNMNFKIKNNNIKKKIEQYYTKGKLSLASAQIQKDLCSDDLSKLLSRTRLLKNAQATENLLEAARLNRNGDELDYNGNENASLFSESTSNILSTDSSSHNTLTRDSSKTAIRSDEFFEIHTDSVVKLGSHPGVTSPYKSDFFNVALAYNTTLITAEKPSAEKDRFSFGSLTSTETLIAADGGHLTSNPPSVVSKNNKNPQVLHVSQQDYHDRTLQGEKTNLEETIYYDQFFTAKTSSYFQKPSFDSVHSRSDFYTPIVCDNKKKNNEYTSQIVDSETSHARSVHSNKNNIFDTVINLGTDTELAPSTSSGSEFKDSLENQVIVTEKQPSSFVVDKQASLPQTDNKTFDRIKKSRTVFKKYQYYNMNKNLSLPNNTAISAMLHDVNLRKTNLEQTNYVLRPDVPRSIPELWEKLSLLLDSAITRLEQTLTEKIIKEIENKSFSDSQAIHHKNKVQNHVITANKSLNIKLSVLKTSEDKEVLAKEESVTIIDEDKNFQCDLIESKVIDQLMLRLSFEHPKALVSRVSPVKILRTPSTSDRLKEPQILKKCFELLNPPSSETQTLEEIKAAEISATATLQSNNTAIIPCSLSKRFKGVLETPAEFIKENALVITTVPVFFLGLFTLYCLIALATKL